MPEVQRYLFARKPNGGQEITLPKMSGSICGADNRFETGDIRAVNGTG